MTNRNRFSFGMSSVIILLHIAAFLQQAINGYTVRQSVIQWVPRSDVDINFIESVGRPNTANKMYIGRTNFIGGMIPGRVNSSAIWFGFNGTEFRRVDINQYTILICPAGSLAWVPVQNQKTLPDNLLQAGLEPFTFEPSYVCRTTHENLWNIGKFLKSEKTCRVPFGGKEQSYNGNFELLVNANSTFYSDPELGF